MQSPIEQDILAALDNVLAQRRHGDPEASYVASLHHRGLNKILEKVGEESTEVILAAKDVESGAGPEREALIGEMADLWFHSLVLLSHQGFSSRDVLGCLQQRFGLSGHVEKAQREAVPAPTNDS